MNAFDTWVAGARSGVAAHELDPNTVVLPEQYHPQALEYLRRVPFEVLLTGHRNGFVHGVKLPGLGADEEEIVGRRAKACEIAEPDTTSWIGTETTTRSVLGFARACARMVLRDVPGDMDLFQEMLDDLDMSWVIREDLGSRGHYARVLSRLADPTDPCDGPVLEHLRTWRGEARLRAFCNIKTFAHDVYDVLAAYGGANPSAGQYQSFANHFDPDERWQGEWRFIGELGGGGKFWWDTERWWVNAYSEDMTDYRRDVIAECNKKLQPLYDSWRRHAELQANRGR